MKYTLVKPTQKPLLHSKCNVVIEVNDEFTRLTGYAKNELIGKSLMEISDILRIGYRFKLENSREEYSCYLFTKEYEPREVTVFCKSLKCEDENVYIIKEKQNSRIENKLPYVSSILSSNEMGVAIYSIVDGILLKANRKFLDFCDAYCNKKENSIGKTPEEIFDGYNGSAFARVFLDVIKTGKAFYLKESKCENVRTGEYYLNMSIVPVYISGKAKYIVQTISDITEQVVNRKVIQEQKEELETIIQNMSDGLFIINKDFKYSFVNYTAQQYVYKFSSFKKYGDTLSHTKYCDSEYNILPIKSLPASRILRGEEIKGYRLIAHRPDGIYHFDVSGSPIYDKERNVVKAIIYFRDITEDVNKNELIRQQKEQLEAIVENMSDAFVTFDRNGNITRFNKTAESSPWYAVESEKVDNLFRQYKVFDMEGNAIPRGDSPIRRILRGEKLSQYQIAVRTDSGNFYTESSGDALYDEKGDFVVGMLLTHDITDRVKSQEKLLIKTQLDLFDQVIENLEVGFTRYTYPEFNIIDINNRTYRYLKEFNPKLSSPSSIIGKGIANIFNLSRDKEAEFKRRIQIAIAAKIKPNSIYKSIVIEGKERFLKLVHQPLFGLNNQVVEIVGISIDITEEVKAKKEMEQILKIQEELFANVSHELKTPLNVIFSANQLMELYIKNDSLEANKEKVSKNINIIKQNCYRFTKLINNIVDLSKIESGFLKLNLSNENIVKITEDIVQSVSEYIKRKRLSIVFDTNIEEKIIACDPEKIERIILNLISNAIKFSNSGGSILVNLIDKGDTIEIAVEDTGIGIDRKHLDMIFERFQQADKSLSRNAEGSGIGLYLVKSIIEMHGGKTSVESTVGKGSIFKVELPSKTFEKQEQIYESKSQENKIEMIDIEFSDIYAV